MTYDLALFVLRALVIGACMAWPVLIARSLRP